MMDVTYFLIWFALASSHSWNRCILDDAGLIEGMAHCYGSWPSWVIIILPSAFEQFFICSICIGGHVICGQFPISLRVTVYPYMDQLRMVWRFSVKPLILVYCHMNCRSVPSDAKLKGYRYLLWAPLLQHCLTSHLVYWLSLQYHVLRYLGNTAIMFASPFTSHSRPPKKHSSCHHSELTKQAYYNVHC